MQLCTYMRPGGMKRRFCDFQRRHYYKAFETQGNLNFTYCDLISFETLCHTKSLTPITHVPMLIFRFTSYIVAVQYDSFDLTKSLHLKVCYLFFISAFTVIDYKSPPDDHAKEKLGNLVHF